MNNEERLDFIRALDSSGVDVSDWEAQFIESTLQRAERYDVLHFTPAQCDAIDKMVEKYEDKI